MYINIYILCVRKLLLGRTKVKHLSSCYWSYWLRPYVAYVMSRKQVIMRPLFMTWEKSVALYAINSSISSSSSQGNNSLLVVVGYGSLTPASKVWCPLYKKLQQQQQQQQIFLYAGQPGWQRCCLQGIPAAASAFFRMTEVLYVWCSFHCFIHLKSYGVQTWLPSISYMVCSLLLLSHHHLPVNH